MCISVLQDSTVLSLFPVTAVLPHRAME